MRHILSNLKQESPALAHKLQQQSDIARFKNIFLTPLEREQILFIFPKNDQLLFAFKHKSLCIEFNHYKHKHIIESLKQQIYAYVPNHILTPPLPPSPPIRFYEHSDGEFENRAKNKYIYDKFESLRLSIKRIWEAQNAT